MRAVHVCGPPKALGAYQSNLSQTSGEGSSCLLLVDPQVDFVTGSLVVPGAVKDCERVSAFISSQGKSLSQIYVTMDSHMRYHIAHKMFWKKLRLKKDKNAAFDWSKADVVSPNPFDAIPYKAVKDFIEEGDYVVRFEPYHEAHKEWVLRYTKTLEEKKGLTLVVWPDHCIIGTPGHNVESKISQALKEWELEHGRNTEYILKGHNSLTEHYSAFQAEVEVPDDDKTRFNERLYEALIAFDTIYVAGEARSHCVNHTVRHLVERMQRDGLSVSKVTLLKGGMSDVGGFEEVGEKFWTTMCTQGVQVVDTLKTGIAQ